MDLKGASVTQIEENGYQKVIQVNSIVGGNAKGSEGSNLV